MIGAHTPGPWKIGPRGAHTKHERDEWETVYEPSHAGSTYGARHVAHVCQWGGPDDESRANARLIAAAPDLLAACKEAMDATNAAPGKAFPSAEDWRACYRSQIEKVRRLIAAALAKAEGR